MIYVDPASPAFERLPREHQAWIYRHHLGWKVEVLVSWFGVNRATIQKWTTPGAKERIKANRARYRATEAYKVAKKEQDKRRRARQREKAKRSRCLVSTVFVDPAHPAFPNLPWQQQAQIYASKGWSLGAIAEELDKTRSAVRYWIDPAFREWKKADAYRRQKEAA